ncbi:methyltransferase domain-containing protein [Rhodobacteraceae bacterium 2CG4]|uniref:Methyltransferase domain-containing protein n=1 Tax=Halovulum marinum TaxID=2662447 RepID=A0A6L5YV72_9RHOB|nr:class I SAM-dependent methyltransferase [Halovulum marinum]MSU88157.1 methyltransferase domain-containing protein [Halovulum marinum]
MAYYDAEARAFGDHAEAQADHVRLEAFAALLPDGGRVLDYGCGTGWAAAALAARGFRADATDASEGMIAEAARRHGVAARRAVFRTLSVRQRYDGIWCADALHHADRADRAAIFERMGTALRPGAPLFLSVLKGPVDWRDERGCLFCPFREDEMTELLAANGFEMPDYDHGTGRLFDGKPVLTLYVQALAHG